MTSGDATARFAQAAPPAPWCTPVVRIRPGRKIIGFWHIAALGDFARIIGEQYHTLIDSGLYAASEKIVVGFIGGRQRVQELQIPLLQDPKFEVFLTADVQDYEFPTLTRVWQAAQDNPASFLCYYLHTKGATALATPRYEAVNAWRAYMEYFNLEQWEDCVAVLNSHDTCGVELHDNHYSGNFWWATSDYLRKLPSAHTFWEQHRHDRNAAEYFVCMARPRAYCFNDFTEDLYNFRMPAYRYRK